MKVIITGATGFIGGEVLRQCIQKPVITSICTLTRSPLPNDLASHPKVTSIIISDFLHYSEQTLEQLAGAEACFWMLGMKRPLPNTDPRTVEIGYSQAAAQAFAQHLQPQLPPGAKFRFVFTSGILSEKDPTKSLWFLADGRRIRGEAEIQILAFAGKNAESFLSYVVRPGMVLAKTNSCASILEWLADWGFVGVECLALAAIGLVDEAGKSATFENPELLARGRKVKHT